jgi:hypothetical protein
MANDKEKQGFLVGLEKRGPEKYFQVFFYYGQKNVFVDLHLSGNSKTFSPI